MAPMLAKLAPGPFHREGWVYEEKYDGYRLMAVKHGRAVQLTSRRGLDHAADYPAISSALAALSEPTLVLDGEVVIFDPGGVSRFQLLQRRELGDAPGEPVFVAFDCLYAGGRDLRAQPLRERRAALERVLGRAASAAVRARVRLAQRLDRDGLAAYAEARRRGLEGVMAKDAASPYRSGARSDEWLKVKVRLEDELVVGGFTEPRGKRTDLGALLVGYYDARGRLRYAGKVGTGYTAETLAELARRLAPLERDASPFADEVRERGGIAIHWVEPALVGQFAYAEITREGRVRQAAFLGLREDKSPREVGRPGNAR